jgi:hypothetical protein
VPLINKATLRKSRKGIRKNLQKSEAAAISKGVAAAIALVIIFLLGFGVYYSYLNARNAEQVNSATVRTVIAPAAYQMWQNIGERNVSAIMSGYAHDYEAVWWFYNGSAPLAAIDGKHDCNQPLGAGNCSRNVLLVWEDYVNNTIPFKYSICNANFSQGTGNWFYSRGTMWLASYSGNETVRAQVEIDFQLVDNMWFLHRVWFGLPGDPALVMRGNVTHPCAPDQYA